MRHVETHIVVRQMVRLCEYAAPSRSQDPQCRDRTSGLQRKHCLQRVVALASRPGHLRPRAPACKGEGLLEWELHSGNVPMMTTEALEDGCGDDHACSPIIDVRSTPLPHAIVSSACLCSMCVAQRLLRMRRGMPSCLSHAKGGLREASPCEHPKHGDAPRLDCAQSRRQ